MLLGIATQIASGIEGAKSEMTGLITGAELRWQSKLSEQLEAQEAEEPAVSPVGAAEHIAEHIAELPVLRQGTSTSDGLRTDSVLEQSKMGQYPPA